MRLVMCRPANVVATPEPMIHASHIPEEVSRLADTAHRLD